ncbi:hemicentin-1-like isoform X2 [Anguilla anguilla]|uniref:hemicentin-1-like isoform X2 n=1 Tax=Anguilla anguilla TaxID=7936 RepID=UPI0015B35C57|nr:hemicentin-1-like isoform X2 [Anguilla anguilla]
MEQKKCTFLLMVGLLLERMFCTNGNSSECPLVIQPSTVVVRYGDPVSVNCTVPGDHEGIGWETSEGSVDMVSNGQFVTWSLESLTDWETRPKCFGNFLINADYDQCDKKLNITVYKPSDSVLISAVNHTGPMLEGKKYQLQCEVQNIAPVQYLTVKWYKGETLENQTSYDALTKTPVTVSSTVLITPTSADDGAQYSCVAELELGPEGPQPPPSYKSDPLNITVHYKPRITECPDRMMLREGESLDTLASCRAEGNPSPMVTWYRDQSEFNSSTQLTKRQGGQYTLIAKNTYGTANHTLKIEVLYKPRITECPDHVKLREGESLDTLVSCRAEGNPSPMVTWYRDQSEFNSSTQLTKRQGGQYTLKAKNTYGTANHTLGIEILYSSECPLMIQPPTVVVRYGDPVSVNCTVPGDHEGIGWEASEGSVDMKSNVQFVTWSLETLTDWEISPKCFGNFLINGEPDQCAKELNITVYKPSDSVFISAMNHIGPMLEGKQYQLRCEVQNIAPVQYLTVKWYKGETLENQTSYDALTKTPVTVSSTVLITPTSADDGVQYSCVAELELGPEGPQPPPSYKSDPLNITVHYKPRITECLGHVKLRESESLDTLASCRAEGNPSPMVTWYRDQSEFNSSTQLTKRQGGQYTLIAKNTYGTANHTLEIEVLYSSECPLMIQPSTVVVRYGDPVLVNCTVPEDHEGIGWEASEGSVDRVEGVEFVTWSLESLTDWVISPKCFGNFLINGEPDQCDKKLNITVYKPSDSVYISAVNHTGPMLEGEQYQLQCEVQNIAPVQYLTVKWYKGETLENETSYDALTKTPVNVSSTLLVKPTSADDGAQYSCVAVLELGPEGPQPPPSYKSDPLNITVHYKPRITKCLRNVKLREGESLDTLASCRAEGNPSPMVKWYRDQSEFNSSTQLTKRQGGQYTLVAKNTYGTANHTLGIEILYSSECPLMIQPSTVVVRYGDPVSVNCTVSGDHEGIRWEASEESVDMMPDVQFVTWRLETLTDWETRPKCFGEFLINAELSQCDKKLNITVYKPLDSVSISAMNHTGPMLEQEQYQLQCEVQNIAPVQYLTVKWYKGETLENQTSYDALTKTPVNVSSTLLITSTSADDGAQYSCVAELELGPEGPQPPPSNKSDPLNITVHYKPRITECPDHVKLREGESLDTLVSCRTEGNPSPMVTWYRDQSEFNSSTQLTKRQGGQYTLIAKNTYGTANQTLEIEVLYPPRFEQVKEWVNVTQGDEVILECLAEGNPSPVLTWETTAAEIPQVSTRRRQSNAIISRATSSNAGVYTCNATNDQGMSSKTVTVTVMEKGRTKLGYVYVLVILGIVFILVLIILSLRSKMKHRGNYNVTSIGRRASVEIPLNSCNSNGIASCT